MYRKQNVLINNANALLWITGKVYDTLTGAFFGSLLWASWVDIFSRSWRRWNRPRL